MVCYHVRFARCNTRWTSQIMIHKSIALLALFWLACGALAAVGAATVGTVKDIKIAGNYVYLKTAVGDEEVWIAALASRVEAAVGDEVEYRGGMEMRDFHSKGLDQTFESLLFVDTIRNITNPDPIKDKPMPADEVHRKLREPVLAPTAGEIEPVADGKTVAEVFSNREALNGQRVLVRAKITKVSPNIMGKNWVTLQDGTGRAPNDKIMATTRERVYAGDVVIVDGRVRTNVDLGAGYHYAVVLEEASFTAQP